MSKLAICAAALSFAAAAGSAHAAQSWCDSAERPVAGNLRVDQVFVPDSDVQDQARTELKSKPFEPLDAKMADALSVPVALRTPNALLVRTGGYPGPSGMPQVEVYFEDRTGELEIQTFSLSKLQQKPENFVIVVVAPQPVKRIKSLCFAAG